MTTSLEPTGAAKTLGLIGAGKVGTVLAAAFARVGYLPVAALASSAAGMANLTRLVGGRFRNGCRTCFRRISP